MLSLLFIAISRVTLSYDDEYYARSCLDTNKDDGLREAETETDDYGGGRGLLLHRRQVRARHGVQQGAVQPHHGHQLLE